MGVTVFEVAEGVTNLQMPNGRAYDEGDIIELTEAATTVLGREAITADPEDVGLFQSALQRLVQGGDLLPRGALDPVSVSSNGDARVLWSNLQYLIDLSAGELVRIKPGVDGHIVAMYAVVDNPVTTGSKAATLRAYISGSAVSDAVILLTQTGTPTGGDSTIELSAAGVTYDGFDIAFDDTVPEVQAKVDAVDGLEGNITVGGSTGAWTLTGVNDLANIEIAAAVDDNLTGGTSPALAATNSTVGGVPASVAGTIALTSAAATPANKVIASSANVTANNAFTDEQYIVLQASAVTAFVEGSITIYVLLQQD
mgnify:CR=1 FL=1